MANIKKFIRRTKLKTRVLSVVLVIAILCGSLVWFGNNDMGNVAAEGRDKQYVQHIVDRITSGHQPKFRILEIVPYDGFGEFRYFLNDAKVVSKLEKKINAMPNGTERDYKWCSKEDTDWKILQGTGFGAFGYKVRYNNITNKFEVKGDDTFLQKMFGEQSGIISGKIQLDTVEAKNLTTDMINNADLIVFSSAPHDDGTIRLYEAWTGNDSYSDNIDIDAGKYYDVAGDMSFDALKALLDCTVKGRSLPLPNGNNVTLRTPVILDSSKVSVLKNDSNVYKFNLVYRTLCGADSIVNDSMVATYESLIDNLKNVGDIGAYLSGKGYTNYVSNCFDSKYDNWLTDDFFCYDGKALLGQKEPESDVVYYKNTNNWSDVYLFCSSDTAYLDTDAGTKMTKLTDGIYKCKLKGGTTKVNFNKGDVALIETGDLPLPETVNLYVNGTWIIYNEPAVEADYGEISGVTARIGDTATKLENVLQFLLGSKSNQINKSYDYGHTTVEGSSSGFGSMNKIYFDNSATNWGSVYAHMWNGDDKNSWENSPQMTYEGNNIYSIDVPSGYVQVVFKKYAGDVSISNTADRTGDITIQKGKKFIKNSNDGSGKWVDYATPASWSSNSLKVLEVQPCNAFTYAGLTGAKELAKKLLMSGYSSWDEAGGNNDYRHYIDVTCVTTNALNGMSNDFVSDFDMIIIGEKIDILKQDDNKKTIYNDRTLNGYVYLAFGDLFKINTNALGLLPNEYVEVTYDDGVIMSEGNSDKYTEYIYNHFKNNFNNKVLILHNMGYMYGNHEKDNKGESTKPYYKTGGYGNDGKFYSDYKLGNVRGADNDISEITKNKLIKYAESGKPIILSDSLYNLDSLTVYPTSNIYKLCEEFSKYPTDPNNNITDGINRTYSVYSYDNMAGAVNHRATRNPIIEMKEYPTPPTHDSDGIVKTFGSQDIKFKFKITGTKGGNYRIKLYVDKNSDGVYRGIEEGILDKNELYFSRDIELKLNGVDVTCVEYTIDSELSDNFVGMLAWKIEVVELIGGNESSYLNSVKGYSAIKHTGNKVVEVLQIMPNSNGTLNMNSSSYAFKPLLNKIEETTLGYKINVNSITVSDFEKMYNPAKGGVPYEGTLEPGGYIYFKNEVEWSNVYAHFWTDGVFTTEFPGIPMHKLEGTDDIYYVYVADKATKILFTNGSKKTSDIVLPGRDKMYTLNSTGGSWTDKKVLDPSQPRDYLSSYNMVVIGFGDRFGDGDVSNEFGGLKNILDYMKAGKAVLFTHDTLSWRATPNYLAYGKINNSDFGAIGIDKTHLHNHKGESINVSYHDNFAYNITLALRNKVGMDKYGVTLVNKEGHKQPTYASTAVSPSYNKDSLKVEEIHGFTPWFIYRNNFLETFVSNYNSVDNSNNSLTATGMYSIKPYKDGLCDYDYYNYDLTEPWTTQKVLQLNEGAITMYPYNIDKELTVADTHAQYYSIDMEDEEIVVWYTLAGDGSNISKYYELSNKDAENNYYIYSKNNITYSGAGHSAMSSDMENKLFVNTVIKAIAGGNSSPVLKITNGSLGAGGIHTVRVNSADTASNYEIHLYAKDADLVAPESMGIDKMITEAEIAAGIRDEKGNLINTSAIGKFEWAKVYWDNSNNPTEPIFEYKGNSSDALRNGVIKEIRLGDSEELGEEDSGYLCDTDGNNVLEDVSALRYIEYLVEGNPYEDNPPGADFTIVVSDWLGAETTIKVKLVKRDWFMLE